MKWPDDYWPKDPAPPSQQAWTDSLASFARSREALKRLAHDVEDLTATVPTGTGKQTYLRAILLAADHAAYHVGQIVAVRRALGIWPPADEADRSINLYATPDAGMDVRHNSATGRAAAASPWSMRKIERGWIHDDSSGSS